jgi:ubiquinone/menaquinone biosynthesis C-methylase UbiE
MKYYNALGIGYNALHREEQEHKLHEIKQVIHPKKDEILLDIGCGTGISSNWSCQVIGIDPSEKLIQIARKNYPQHTFIIGKAETLPFQDHNFDYVICVSCIHHCDFSKSVSEMIRVGKKTFVVTILKKSSKYEKIMKTLEGKLRIRRLVETQWDSVLFLSIR